MIKNQVGRPATAEPLVDKDGGDGKVDNRVSESGKGGWKGDKGGGAGSSTDGKGKGTGKGAKGKGKGKSHEV